LANRTLRPHGRIISPTNSSREHQHSGNNPLLGLGVRFFGLLHLRHLHLLFAAAFGSTNAFGQAPQPQANPMFGSLANNPNPSTNTGGFGTWFVSAPFLWVLCLLIHKARLVLPTRKQTPLIHFLEDPNHQPALERLVARPRPRSAAVVRLATTQPTQLVLPVYLASLPAQLVSVQTPEQTCSINHLQPVSGARKVSV
jgi:hypothetical protein